MPPAPGREAAPGGGHGAVHVLGGADGEPAEQGAPVDGAAVLEHLSLAHGLAVLMALDQVPVPAAEGRPQAVEGHVPAVLELLALAAGEGRVRDPFRCLAHAGYSRPNPIADQERSNMLRSLLRRERPARAAERAASRY